MNTDDLAQAASAMIVEAGLDKSFDLQQLCGGGNNRVYRVTTPQSSALLKAYFQHPADPRDRLGAEWAFSSYAWNHGVRALPRPLNHDRSLSLGLYEFVGGRKLNPPEVNATAVRQALEFFHELNENRHLPTARALPVGSEAGFSLDDHFRCIERRVTRLKSVEETSNVHREATTFIREELLRIWSEYEQFYAQSANELGLNVDAEIPDVDRCISPSDFGFHNALLAADGRMRFIDFEYAGWDDPVRMICDFFCQPAVPVSMEHFDWFSKAVIGRLSNPELHLHRLAVMLPLYQIKWCCIILNHFLPVGNQRRRFAGTAADLDEQKSHQLEKARSNLNRIVLRSAA